LKKSILTIHGLTKKIPVVGGSSGLSILVALLCSCSSGGDGGSDPEFIGTVPCSRELLVEELDEYLDQNKPNDPFSAHFVRVSDGLSYTYEPPLTTSFNDRFRSASTSKWVTASVILNLVEQGSMSLDDSPQDYLSEQEWPIPQNDNLRGITLHHLLGFTSGLSEEPLCLNLDLGFFQCVTRIAEQNQGGNIEPGDEFYYSSSHLQVAGAMAIRASGALSWSELFSRFVSQKSVLFSSEYNLPSIRNPRLAGGMTWTPNDYAGFISAFIDGDIIDFDEMIKDQVGDVTIANTPADRIEEDWRYGYGLWVECPQAQFDPQACLPAKSVSSPGTYGSYPLWNIEKEYYGILAMELEIASFPEGHALFSGMKTAVEEWVNCDNP